MTNESTLHDLSKALIGMHGRSIKLCARGGIYIATIRYPGGTAQFANDTLSGAINGAIALQTGMPEEPEVTPDPTGTKIGVAPAEEPEL